MEHESYLTQHIWSVSCGGGGGGEKEGLQESKHRIEIEKSVIKYLHANTKSQ